MKPLSLVALAAAAGTYAFREMHVSPRAEAADAAGAGAAGGVWAMAAVQSWQAQAMTDSGNQGRRGREEAWDMMFSGHPEATGRWRKAGARPAGPGRAP